MYIYIYLSLVHCLVCMWACVQCVCGRVFSVYVGVCLFDACMTHSVNIPDLDQFYEHEKSECLCLNAPTTRLDMCVSASTMHLRMHVHNVDLHLLSDTQSK